MDKFVEKLSCNDKVLGPASTMGYYDGNTVTAMWNYAQNFAMSDNSYSTTFGPSTPGVINLVSGQTNGVTATLNGTGDEVAGGSDGWRLPGYSVSIEPGISISRGKDYLSVTAPVAVYRCV